MMNYLITRMYRMFVDNLKSAIDLAGCDLIMGFPLTTAALASQVIILLHHTLSYCWYLQEIKIVKLTTNMTSDVSGGENNSLLETFHGTPTLL